MDINQLVENALEFGFEKIKEKSTIKGIEYETYEYKTDFWVRGEHSYDMVNIYLLVNYEKEIGYLCYSPSIAYCIPPTDKQEFYQWLDEAAEYAASVSDTCVYCAHEIFGVFERNPLTCELTSEEDVIDLEWFIRAMMCYQTVIELMADERYIKA